MTKPRIYGDEARFRAALTRAIRSGEALLAQTDGVRERMKLAQGSKLDEIAIEQEWEGAFRRWFNATGNALVKFLQEQLNPSWNSAPGDDEVLSTLSNGLPPDDGKPRHSIGIESGEEWLSKTLDELRTLAAEFPPPARARTSTKASASDTRTRRESLLTNPWVIGLGVLGSGASVVGLVIAVVLLLH
jgi:hypothetical protein